MSGKTRTVTMSGGKMVEVPYNCTMCGEAFKTKEKRHIYPYPEKQWLCFECFDEAIETGLGRLNKALRGEPLTEEDFKPHSRSSEQTMVKEAED